MTNLSRRFAGAFIGNAAGRFLRIAEQFLLVPLYIAAWGLDGYGAWILLMSGASFVALANGGIGYAAAADIVIAHARDDRATVARVLRTALTLITCAIGLGLFLVIAFVLVFDLSQPAPIGMDARAIVVLLAVSVLVAFYVEPLAGVLGAIRGAGLPMQVQAGVKAVELLAVGAALICGLSPLVVAALLTTSAVTNVAVHVWLVRRFAASLPLIGGLDREVVSRNWRSALGFFGLFFAMNVVNLQTPRLIVGLFAGPAALSAFTVLATYTRTARSFAAMIAQSLQVEVGRMAGAGQFEALRGLARATLRRSLAASMILIGGALIVAPWFIPLWTHGQVAVAWPVVIPLAMVAIIGTMFDASLALASGLNRVGRIAVFYGSGSFAMVLLSALGAALTGAPAAVAMAMLAPEISGVYAASRTLKPFTTPPVDQ